MLKVIRDDRTPACLPRWARDELVDLRLRGEDLMRENMRLQKELAVAQGASPFEAAMAGIKSLQGERD